MELGAIIRDYTSAFLASSIPVEQNAIKSIVFRCAEVLLGLFIFKFLSLLAAWSNHFTAYLMFAEDYIQRCLFLTSRGFSRATLLVLLFTILNMAASLYGSLLWALDSPGYVFRTSNSTLAEHRDARKPDAPYIVQLHLDPTTLDYTDQTLHQLVGAELFRQGFNISLTGDVKKGTPETTAPTLNDVEPRIWLDEEGFSISTDTYVMLPNTEEKNGEEFPFGCIFPVFQGIRAWNCTFHSTFAADIFQGPMGRPLIHFDDKSSFNDSQYVIPNRVDNVWSSYSTGGGTATMMQVFTVTKGKRRHTFVSSFFRATMVTNPGVMFAPEEVDDFVHRAVGLNDTLRADPIFDQIVRDMLRAQDGRKSYNFGVNAAENNKTVGQDTFSYFNILNEVSLEESMSVIHISYTNITLIRSEDIDDPPAPLRECDQPFINEAYGGKITQTNCAGATLSSEGARFYGTVDTAAVMILYGLGHGRSNISAESMNQEVMEWVWNNYPRMMDLLIARGFALSVNPALVTVTVQHMIAAMSGLQLLLSVLAAVLAAAAWGLLAWCADRGWSKSFLQNVVHSTLYWGTPESRKFYMKATPHVDMIVHKEGDYVVVDGRPVTLPAAPVTPVVPVQQAHYFNGEPPKEAMTANVTPNDWGAATGYQYPPAAVYQYGPAPGHQHGPVAQ